MKSATTEKWRCQWISFAKGDLLVKLDRKVGHGPYFYLSILTILQMDSLCILTGHMRGTLMKVFVTKFFALRKSFIIVAQVVLKF